MSRPVRSPRRDRRAALRALLVEPLEERRLLAVVANPGGPPNGPFGLTAVVQNSTTVNLSFHDYADNETGFLVERAASAAGPFGPLTTLPPATGTGGVVTFTDTTALPGTPVFYRVSAVNGPFGSSINGPIQVNTTAGPGVVTNASPVPNGPYGLQLTDLSSDGHGVDLSFIDNADNETGFVLERGFSSGGPFTQVSPIAASPNPHQTITVTDQTTLPGTTYYYRVFAVNGQYASAIAGPLKVTTLGTLGDVPTNLTATALNTGPHQFAVQLNFTDTSTAETQYVVQRRQLATDPWADVGQTGPAAGSGSTLTFVDPNVSIGVTYSYRVHAVLPGSIAGPDSAIATANTGPDLSPNTVNPGGAPNGPYGLAVLSASTSSITLAFTDNATNEVAHNVERSTSPNGPWVPLGSIVGSAGAGNRITFTDGSGLAPATTYYYRVYAVNGPYTSSVDGPLQASTTGSGFGGPGNPNPGGAPNGPFGLHLTATPLTVLGSFTEYSDNETGFVIERSASAAGPFTRVASFTPLPGTGNVVNFADGSVVSGSSYYYRVFAVNGPFLSSINGPVLIAVP